MADINLAELAKQLRKLADILDARQVDVEANESNKKLQTLIEKEVSEIFGLKSEYTGYKYVVELIRLGINNEPMRPLKSVGYPKVAEKFSNERKTVTIISVEKCVETVIEIASKQPTEKWNNIVVPNCPKKTPLRIITFLIEYIREL